MARSALAHQNHGLPAHASGGEVVAAGSYDFADEFEIGLDLVLGAVASLGA